MLRSFVGLAMLWAVRSQRCTSDAECPGAKSLCYDNSCRCRGDWTGDDCACSPSETCNGNGQCENSDCICTPGWVGLSCACSPSETCHGHGTCDPLTSACACSTGWTGVYCNIPCTPGTPCASQGVCYTDQHCGQNQHCDDTFSCVCNPGWIGNSCDKTCRTFCSNNGYCDHNTLGLPCLCDDDWYGPHCEVFCDDAQCSQGKCDATGALTACTCDGDWVHWKGAACACSPSLTCSGNGRCEGDVSKCKCNDGWVGPACEFHCDPATTCSDIMCNARGSYNDAKLGCDCDQGFDEDTNCQKCLPHYYGHDCDVYCTDDVTCHGHGECDAGGKCLCEAEYNVTTDCGDQGMIRYWQGVVTKHLANIFSLEFYFSTTRSLRRLKTQRGEDQDRF